MKNRIFPVKSPLLPLVITLAALASACTVGPNYQQPAAPQSAQFKYQDGWQTMPEQPWAASGQWWLAFDDAVLTGLVEQAAQANQTLAQAEARYRAAEAQWRLSRGDYSPQASASLGATRDGGSDRTISEGYNARLDISWAPDLWGRVRRQVEADRAGLQSSAADLAAARLSIQVALTQSYIRLRALDLGRDILEQTMVAYERSTELTRNQYDAGIVSRADVIQAETQRQSLRSDMYDLENQRALEENTIATLLGLTPAEFDLARESQQPQTQTQQPQTQPSQTQPPRYRLPEVPALPATLPSVLIARRPDVVAAERQVAAANARIGVAQAAWLPDITLRVLGGVESGSFSGLFDAPTRVWSVGPTLAQTLFDGGRRRASKDIAIASYDEQVAVYRQTVLDSFRDVEDALATLRILGEKARQQEVLLALAEENERVATNRYRAGLVSFLEVATAQNLTLNARRVSVNVTADRLAATAQLAAAIGGGWELDDPVIQSVTDPG